MIQQYKLSELNENINQIFDLYICFSSFETRCMSFINNIDIQKIKTALVFYNEECLEHIKANMEKIDNLLGKRVRFVNVLHSDPLFTADKMKNSLLDISKNNEINSILLDITTFTHEALLIVFRLLNYVYPVARIKCVYSNAYEYNSNNEKNSKWLSKGISEIRSVLGYSGNIVPAQRTHLILIVGYEYERAISIINALEPNSIALGFGRSDNATTQKDFDANEHFMHLVEQMATNYTDIDCFEVKCNDPIATAETILSKLENVKDKNVLIVPLNNKISTIGVAISAIQNDNVQVCYAPALVYNYTNYSEPGDSCYVINLEECYTNEKES